MGAFLKIPQVLFGGIIFTLFFSSQTLIAQAAINEQIAFYGTLQDTLGTNLVGTYDMVFRFYDAPSGGTLLDISTHTVANGNPVVVSAGEFRVQLGSGTGNALNGLNFNTDNIYIGLTIGSDSEMIPRERLSAAPYAFNADRLDGYDSLDLLRLNTSNTISASTGTTLLSVIQNGVGDILNIFDGGTEVFSILDGGNVGVGTSSPTSKFTVAGDARITGSLRDSSGDAGTNGMVLLSTLTGTNWVATSSLGISGGGGSSLFTDGGATTYLTATGDNLAIGGTGGSARLNVYGDIDVSNDGIIMLNGISYFSASTSAYVTKIGDGAGQSFTEYDALFIGRNAGQNTLTGGNLTYIGEWAGRNHNGYNNTFIGVSARGGGAATGDLNTMVGDSAGYNASGEYNNFFGADAGYVNTGNHNFITGYDAGYYNGGDHNIIMGNQAGLSNYSGNFNQFIGYQTAQFANASATVAIGAQALRGPAGDYDAINNIAIGHRSGYNILTGADNNILIGYQAADNLTTGNNNIIIGYNIDNVTATADNRLNIGNLIFGTGIDGTGTTLSSGNIGIGTTTPAQKLQVFGNIRVGTSGSNGCLENFGGGVIGGTCSSDERLKTNIIELASADRNYLEKIVALKPVSYTWNDLAKNLYKKNGEIENIGLIAQSVEEQFPELVSKNTEGYRQVDFGALPFYLIEAVKELYGKVTGLEEKVKEIDELKERIERLEAETGTSYTPPPAPEPTPAEETPSEPVVSEEVQPEAPPEPDVTQLEAGV